MSSGVGLTHSSSILFNHTSASLVISCLEMNTWKDEINTPQAQESHLGVKNKPVSISYYKPKAYKVAPWQQ